MLYYLNRLKPLFFGLVLTFSAACQQDVKWPDESLTTKPGARWWWLGSAVDEANLTYNLEEYSKAGIGALEITPIYGVQNNDENNIDFLSDRWMQVYKHTQNEAHRLNMQIDMNTGTGWPFGGPQVKPEDAASKLIVQEYSLKGGESLKDKIEPKDERQREFAHLACLMALDGNNQPIDLTSKVSDNQLNWTAPKGEWKIIALFEGHTFQQVKRAAPGGKGLVIDHLSETALPHYLQRFTDAFNKNNAPAPGFFFTDSYEVYQADWTPNLLQAFENKFQYKLQDYLPYFLSSEHNDTTARIISDYRELLSELLVNNFTTKWTEWAHQMGSQTRSQAHGSPGNLIDLYAAVDVPECEGFGLSDFHINGLRKDSLTRHNDSDLSMLKYASSAAHISGKQYTSSETFTWLTEHFRTSLSQCKPDLDLMFVSGVNRVYFHGTTYSPKEAEWPGWKFYASVDMSPTNPLWDDAGAFFKYISRVQSFLQMGQPDNDFLVYLPVYDMWHEQDGRLLMFDIHKMQQRAPEFIDVIHQISNAGYDVDYISDAFIKNTQVSNGQLLTSGGSAYKALIVPAAKKMPADVLQQLIKLAKEGAQIIFMDHYPEDVPGFHQLDERRQALQNSLSQLPQSSFEKSEKLSLGSGSIITGSDFVTTLAKTDIQPEELKKEYGLSYIRRKNTDGHHYFISALKQGDTDQWITLAQPFQSAVIFDPLTGKIGKAAIRSKNGCKQVRIQLNSGASMILKTYTSKTLCCSDWPYINEEKKPFVLNNNWQLYFTESTPAITDTFSMPAVQSWTMLPNPNASINMGTAKYTTTFSAHKDMADEWLLDLGDVRETARVTVNGTMVDTLWSVPYRVRIGSYLKEGLNSLEIEVTNLPANRIAEMDREGIQWRKFKEINLVDINYSRNLYSNWEVMPSGLNSEVKLIPVNLSN
nr:glycosyl hydrolase [uncultured Carboxylicivirga sp.]